MQLIANEIVFPKNVQSSQIITFTPEMNVLKKCFISTVDTSCKILLIARFVYTVLSKRFQSNWKTTNRHCTVNVVFDPEVQSNVVQFATPGKFSFNSFLFCCVFYVYNQFIK